MNITSNCGANIRGTVNAKYEKRCCLMSSSIGHVVSQGSLCPNKMLFVTQLLFTRCYIGVCDFTKANVSDWEGRTLACLLNYFTNLPFFKSCILQKTR